MSVLDINRARFRLERGGYMAKTSAKGLLERADQASSRGEPANLSEAGENREPRWPFIYSVGIGLAASALVCLVIAAAIKFFW